MNRWIGWVLGVLLMGLQSCTTTADGDSNTSEIEKELQNNYSLLSVYFYHPEKLASYDEYLQYDASVLGSYGKILAMYSSLDDRFTRYFTPEQAQAVYNSLTTSEGGALIGITMELKMDTIRVVRVIPSSPAETAGIQKGDQIIEVNGESVVGVGALDRYSELTQGGAGTLITMVLWRNQQKVEVTATKKELMLPTVYLDSVENIPVIQVTEFTEETISEEGTLGEFRQALKQMAGSASAVLDLRGNPGGSVDQCIQMADELIPSGVLIRIVEHRYDFDKKVAVIDTVDSLATLGGLGENTQWVLMADQNSASCAEIFVWAMRSYQPVPVVGDTTYGKGVGQIYTFTYLNGIAGITSLQFFNQNMEGYNGAGIPPTEQILDRELALQRAVELAISKRGLAKANQFLSLSEASLKTFNTVLETQLQNVSSEIGGAWKWKNP